MPWQADANIHAFALPEWPEFFLKAPCRDVASGGWERYREVKMVLATITAVGPNLMRGFIVCVFLHTSSYEYR